MNYWEESALFAAVVNGRKMAVRYLLKYGARIDRMAEVLLTSSVVNVSLNVSLMMPGQIIMTAW